MLNVDETSVGYTMKPRLGNVVAPAVAKVSKQDRGGAWDIPQPHLQFYRCPREATTLPDRFQDEADAQVAAGTESLATNPIEDHCAKVCMDFCCEPGATLARHW